MTRVMGRRYGIREQAGNPRPEGMELPITVAGRVLTLSGRNIGALFPESAIFTGSLEIQTLTRLVCKAMVGNGSSY